jgi:hypothetical protein
MFYNWYGREVFGIEIYNENVGRMHKQMFEMMWKLAKPIIKKMKRQGSK